jgi:small subunit ribosomal protein S20
LIRHKSAEKRARQEKKRRARNVSIKSNTKTSVKAVLKAVEEKSGNASEVLQSAAATLDKAAAKGIIHKNTASRKISRLTKKVNSLK